MNKRKSGGERERVKYEKKKCKIIGFYSFYLFLLIFMKSNVKYLLRLYIYIYIYIEKC